MRTSMRIYTSIAACLQFALNSVKMRPSFYAIMPKEPEMSRIHVPNICPDFNGFNALSNIARAVYTIPKREVTIDINTCSYFDGSMASVLFAALNGHTNTAVFTSTRDAEWRLDFGQRIQFPPFPTETMFTLRQFDGDDARSFNAYVWDIIHTIEPAKMTIAHLTDFKKSLFEIMVNACQHSQSPRGFCCCTQHCPREKKIRVSVSDVGIGIKENVRRFGQKEIADASAIEWAVKFGNSTKLKRSGGFGLDIVRNFISLNRGRFYVVSGKCFYSVTPETFSMDLDNELPGTTIHMEINT